MKITKGKTTTITFEKKDACFFKYPFLSDGHFLLHLEEFGPVTVKFHSSEMLVAYHNRAPFKYDYGHLDLSPDLPDMAAFYTEAKKAETTSLLPTGLLFEDSRVGLMRIFTIGDSFDYVFIDTKYCPLFDLAITSGIKKPIVFGGGVVMPVVAVVPEHLKGGN